MNKNKNEKKFSVKELFINRQYRSIIILAFYAILFTVLIIGIRSPKNTVEKNENGTSISSLSGYELIDNKNFSYKYTIKVDDETFIYEGKKYNDKELVVISKDEESREYYIVGDKTYIKENNKYSLSLSKPIIIFDFFNTNVLDEVIIRGILINEDNHEYKIDNQDLYDVLNTDNTKVEKGDNFATLSYRNSYITGITFDLSNYSKVIGENYNKVIISLEYSDFNLIDDFKEIDID